MIATEQNRDPGIVADNYTGYLNELLELLEQEHGALKNREFENIRQCTKQKEILLNKLEMLDAQQLVVEPQAGPAGATEMPAPFNEKFVSLLKKCSELNAVNGGVVEISKQFNQRMLDTILGADTQDSNLYDAAGNNSANRLKQVFAKI